MTYQPGGSVEGLLEIVPSRTGLVDTKGGLLRTPGGGYSPKKRDAYLPAPLCKEMRLRGGECIAGTLSETPPREWERGPGLQEIHTINGLSIAEHLRTRLFEDLPAVEPQNQLNLATQDGPLATRIIDLMMPLGLGQRSLIVAPPRSGKTILLQQIAHGVAANHPGVHIVLLLVDERPEEVTDMRRTAPGEVVASNNDRESSNHVRLAHLMLERAKRLVEAGKNVVILLDSLTRLARAFNTVAWSGRSRDVNNVEKLLVEDAKNFFGTARNIEYGASLTIIGTLHVETGSRTDDLVYGEFRSAADSEIVLSKELADERVWPAIDLVSSRSRHEERLLGATTLKASQKLRRRFEKTTAPRAMKKMIETMTRHDDNEALAEAVLKSR
ncbi:MAG: transcription termination factor Rho [Planctomycetota bacterium]|nr:transcription termination factor Rho [Planctomycetota bacterium]